ncbi:MAG: hypothetical protein ABIH89_02595, partial [Elusimicrobiota bacterium]
MRFGYIVSVIVAVYLMIYSAGILKEKLPSGEKLEEYIEAVKEFKERGESFLDLAGNEQNSITDLEQRIDEEWSISQKEGIAAELGLDPAAGTFENVRIYAPVMKKIMDICAGYEDTEDIMSDINIGYFRFSRFCMKLSGYCFGTGFMIILLGFISCRLNAFSAASLLGRSVFFLTRVTIFL